MINFNQYEVLTFDCYGTLIDWENGMLAALKPLLSKHNVDLDDEQILKLFAEFESGLEAGEYMRYREVLRGVVRQFGERLGFKLNSAEYLLPDSIKNWQPFPDTVEALKSLKQKFKLAILSNVDDDLFAASAKHLQVEFDWIITAEQAKSYKPSINTFKFAIEKIGLPREKILHVGASIYHDVIPASSVGLSTVFVDRRAGKKGSGAALPATAQPDMVVPDLKTLASRAGLG